MPEEHFNVMDYHGTIRMAHKTNERNTNYGPLYY